MSANGSFSKGFTMTIRLASLALWQPPKCRNTSVLSTVLANYPLCMIPFSLATYVHPNVLNIEDYHKYKWCYEWPGIEHYSSLICYEYSWPVCTHHRSSTSFDFLHRGRKFYTESNYCIWLCELDQLFGICVEKLLPCKKYFRCNNMITINNI